MTGAAAAADAPKVSRRAQRCGRRPARAAADLPERVDETAVDQLAEAELRLLGVPADEAARLVAVPLPTIEAW